MIQTPNILIDELPQTVTVCGKVYSINTNFRVSILFELLMQDDTEEPREKTVKALKLYYPVIPDDLSAAIDAMLWFYGCGKTGNTLKKGYSERSHNRVYSFEYDDDYIFSSFISQYDIDLQQTNYMHWWKFRALFNSLDESNQFVKIMQYRGMDIGDDMPKEQQKFYSRMKKIYALPKSQNEVEKTAAIEDALMNGGDLTGIL